MAVNPNNLYTNITIAKLAKDKLTKVDKAAPFIPYTGTKAIFKIIFMIVALKTI